MFPIISHLDRMSRCVVRLSFTDGAVIDIRIPVKKAGVIRVIDGGAAVKFGAGPRSEVGAWALREWPGLVIFKAPDVGVYPGQTWLYGRAVKERVKKWG